MGKPTARSTAYARARRARRAPAPAPMPVRLAARANLRDLAARRLAEKRQRLDDKGRAERAAWPVHEPYRNAPAPTKTVWEAATGAPAPVS